MFACVQDTCRYVLNTLMTSILILSACWVMFPNKKDARQQYPNLDKSVSLKVDTSKA